MFLRGNRHRPDESHFWRGHSIVRSPPPPQIARYVLPPPLAVSQQKEFKRYVLMVHFAAVGFDGAQRAMQKGETTILQGSNENTF